MSNLDALLAKASADLDSNDLDACEASLDSLLQKLDKALRHRVTVTSHDDGKGDLNASNPSDQVNHDDDQDIGDDGDAEDDDGEDNGKTKKGAMDFLTALRKHSNTYHLNTKSEDDRPGSLTNLPRHPSSDHSRHKFETVVQRLINERGLPRSEALSEARRTHQDLFASYQQHTAGNVSKSASDLVSREMARAGVTEEIAKVRLTQLYGADILGDVTPMTKGDSALYTLEKRAAELADHYGCEMTEALRMAPQESPLLHKRVS
jgi:hypothetical protein